MNYLSEAFKKLDVLDEDVFDVDTKGIRDFKEFKDNDGTDDVITIVDPEAESEEDLSDSYIGKVILDCSVCHTDIYKDKSEVVIDEEQGLANVGEECPYCFSIDGFKVIGEVKAFSETEVETDDDVEVKVDGKEVSNESKSVKKLREASNSSRFDEDKADYNYELESGSFWDSRTYPNATMGRVADILLKVMDYLGHYYGDEGLQYFDNEFLPKAVDSGIKFGITPYKLEFVKNWFDSGMPDDGSKKIWNESLYKSKSKSKSVKESIRIKRGKKQVKRFNEGIGASDFDYFVHVTDELDDFDELYDAMDNAGIGNDWDGDADSGFAFQSAKEARNAIEQLKSIGYNAEYHYDPHEDDDYFNESLENVKLDTGDQEIEITARDKEPIMGGDEMIAPLDDGTEAEIMSNKAEDSEKDSDEVDADLDDFSEKEFDDLGESYLKRVYNNVDSYKTVKASSNGNTLKLEGLIKFKSGKTKKTSFVFESSTITKSGKAKFIGENAQISRGKKSFTLTGSLKNNKFIAESLNYNYRAKDAGSGESTRVYGTVTNKK